MGGNVTLSAHFGFFLSQKTRIGKGPKKNAGLSKVWWSCKCWAMAPIQLITYRLVWSCPGLYLPSLRNIATCETIKACPWSLSRKTACHCPTFPSSETNIHIWKVALIVKLLVLKMHLNVRKTHRKIYLACISLYTRIKLYSKWNYRNGYLEYNSLNDMTFNNLNRAFMSLNYQ